MRQHPLDREMRLSGIGGAQHGGNAGATGTQLTVGRRRKRNRHQKPGMDTRPLPSPTLLTGAVGGETAFCITTRRRERSVLNVWNESGTNHGRIGDSAPVRIRSLRYMAADRLLNTRSGGILGSS